MKGGKERQNKIEKKILLIHIAKRNPQMSCAQVLRLFPSLHGKRGRTRERKEHGERER